MGRDLFLILFALIFSAVWKTDLLWTVAVVDIADRLVRLTVSVYIASRRGRKVKSPSSSAKRNGRLRKRN